MNEDVLFRYRKSVKNSNGNRTISFPKLAVDKLGLDFIFDIYEDKIILHPAKK
ncbi:MAG: hypothetical protein RR662_07150 [Clostridia bacterium]